MRMRSRPGRRPTVSSPWPVDVAHRRTCRPARATLVAVGVITAHVASLFADDPVRIGANLDRPHSLAVSANGQTVVTIAGHADSIMASDPGHEGPWREVVAGAGEAIARPVAIGSMPGDVVAAVCRDGDVWTLRTFRIGPEMAADPASPLQAVQLGTASGKAEHVAIAVHQSRGWLVVVGLPSPLPSVVRCAIAGVRVGPPSDRSCPRLPEEHRPVAVAINAAGDILLVLRPDTGDDVLAFYDAAGRELLRLSTGLRRVAAITVSRGEDLLWAAGTSDQGKTGLWRLDAALRDRRQVVKPVLAHPLTAPTALVSASDRALIVIDGSPKATMLRIRPPSLERSGSGRNLP